MGQEHMKYTLETQAEQSWQKKSLNLSFIVLTNIITIYGVFINFLAIKPYFHIEFKKCMLNDKLSCAFLFLRNNDDDLYFFLEYGKLGKIMFISEQQQQQK